MNHLDNLTLSLLADEVLPKTEADRALRHIKSCPQCEQAYDDFQAISFQLAKLPHIAPPEGYAVLQSNIMANLPPQDAVSPENTISLENNRKMPHPITYSNWKQWGLYAACLALLIASFYNPPTQNLETNDYSSSSSSSSGSSIDALQERSVPESEAFAMMEDAMMEDAMMAASADYDISHWQESMEANPYIASFQDLAPEQQEFLAQIDCGFLLSSLPENTLPEFETWDEVENYYQFTIHKEDYPLYEENFPELLVLYEEYQVPTVFFFYPQ